MSGGLAPITVAVVIIFYRSKAHRVAKVVERVASFEHKIYGYTLSRSPSSRPNSDIAGIMPGTVANGPTVSMSCKDLLYFEAQTSMLTV